MTPIDDRADLPCFRADVQAA